MALLVLWTATLSDADLDILVEEDGDQLFAAIAAIHQIVTTELWHS